MKSQSQAGQREPGLAHPLTVARQEFLRASVAVWREIDRLSAEPSGYRGLPPETDLRKRERAAWQSYRDLLAATGEEL